MSVLCLGKNVAHAPDSNHAFGLFGVVFDLGANSRYMNINRTIKSLEVGALQSIHNLITRQHPSGTLSQHGKQLELVGSQLATLVIHEGVVFEAGVDRKGVVKVAARPMFFSIGPSAVFADSRYMQSFYGINAQQSRDSGLSQYDAAAGLVSIGLRANLVLPLNSAWSIGTFAGIDKLGSRAKTSPLVESRGDNTQWQGGVFLSLRF